MRKYIRPAISLATIGVFLIMAMASFGPDESTNTTVAISNCQEKPSKSVKLNVTVRLRWEDLAPVTGIEGTLFISHQKVTSNEDCTFTVTDQQQVHFTTDGNGDFIYPGNTWTHDNSEDLIRVEIYLYPDPKKLFTGLKNVQVLKYAGQDFYFYETIYPLL